MARSFFVYPEQVTLPLPGGNALFVKKRLNSKESRRMFAACVRSMSPGEKIELDPEQVGYTKVVAYLVGWSGPNFVDPNGNPMPYSASALDNLSNEIYTDIVKAIDAHENEQDAAIELEKNTQAGSGNSGPISASVA